MKCSSSLFCVLSFHTLFLSGHCNVLASATNSVSALANSTSPSTPTPPATSLVNASATASTTFSANATVTTTTTTTTSTSSANTTTTTTMGQPTQTVGPVTLQALDTIHERRLTNIISHLTNVSSISAWLSTLGPDGKWPASEVDYTTGCDARRANWPAQAHWTRITTMAAAWHGGLNGAGPSFVKSPTLRAAISLAMDFWFANDFTEPSCLDFGGTPACPCGTPGLWNTNWFSNIILIPEFVGQTCLMLNDTLVDTQLSNCSNIIDRAYGTFDRNINGIGTLTGANALDVAKVGIDLGLLTVNVSLVTDAYRRLHLQLVIEDAPTADGIRPDGTFGQHNGILYNGNYGKDFTNDLLDLEIESAGTPFEANADSMAAFATLFDGLEWMIFRNVLTETLHWDFSVLGRFISFPVIDNQATAGILINLTQVQVLGEEWQSQIMVNVAKDLRKNTTNANAGSLQGNRMFYANDYMASVHRGPGYVTTVKMYSTRTTNTECANLQNPHGFHLSDGTVYTYLQGNEYEDIFAAWDWNKIPGTTEDMDATPLNCAQTQWQGIEAFVGGTSDGVVGVAAMRYTNPLTKALRWQKTWFFLEDDVQHVMISNITSMTNASVISILDQKRHNGPVIVDDVVCNGGMSKISSTQSLWHDNVGYTLPSTSDAFTLSFDVGVKTGNWTAIGTSTQPPASVDLFAAWIDHEDVGVPVSYSIFPATDFGTFHTKSLKLRLQEIQNNPYISAIFDETHNTALMVFWAATGGSAHFVPSVTEASITIASSGYAGVIYCMDTGIITVSDPSQTLITVQITLTLDGVGTKPAHWGKGRTKILLINLPSGGLAGSSVSQYIQDL